MARADLTRFAYMQPRLQVIYKNTFDETRMHDIKSITVIELHWLSDKVTKSQEVWRPVLLISILKAHTGKLQRSILVKRGNIHSNVPTNGIKLQLIKIVGHLQ